jgi:hypothetical protein
MVEYKLKDEHDLIENFMSKNTGKRLINIVEQNLIHANILTIFSNGFEGIINDNDFLNVERLYRFLERVDKLDYIKKNWNFYIKSRGTSIINLENQELIIEEILKFINTLD